MAHLKKLLLFIRDLLLPPKSGHNESLIHEWLRALPIILIFTTITVTAHGIGLLDSFDNVVFDTMIRGNPLSIDHTYLIDINDDDYDKLFSSTSPLDPAAVMNIIDAIEKIQPVAIVVDIDTGSAKYTDFGRDAAHANVIWGRPGTVNGSNSDVDAKVRENKTQVMKLQPVLGSKTPANINYGIATMISDSDGVVRKYPLKVIDVDQPKQEILSLPEAAASYYLSTKPGHQSEIAHEHGNVMFDFPWHPSSYPGMSASQFLSMAHKNPAGLAKLIGHRIVLLGGTFSASKDFYPTPKGLMPGVELVGFAIESRLQNRSLSEVQDWLMIVSDIAAGFIFIWLTRVISSKALFWTLLLLPFLGLFFSCLTYNRLSMWVTFVPVMFGSYMHSIYDHLMEHHTLKRELSEKEEKIRTLEQVLKEKENV